MNLKFGDHVLDVYSSSHAQFHAVRSMQTGDNDLLFLKQ